jgi:hypothetical protein
MKNEGLGGAVKSDESAYDCKKGEKVGRFER